MEEQLSLDFLRVVENAAIAAARTMGFGDRHHADEVAVEAMRKTMDSVEIDGTIVIGEGERDEAPMLYIGEKVGRGAAEDPEVDIALDPLEGTTITATGGPNALSVIAMAEKGNLLNAPDTYMDKLAVGPSGARAQDGDHRPEQDLHARRDGARPRRVRGDRGDQRRFPQRRALLQGRGGDAVGRHALEEPHHPVSGDDALLRAQTELRPVTTAAHGHLIWGWVLALREMASARRSIEVDVPPERFFEVVRDYARYPEFLPEVKAVSVGPRTGNAVEVTYRRDARIK